ncbi:hypothetical protein J4405_04105 [Candidatus Woesearchaeota archaeon]|nr:hypothetical protein [Candidatus Woesearchaeota archaeon]
MTKEIPWNKRPLVRSYDALAMIHMGFDPDNADDHQYREESIIPKIFGQVQSPMLLFNHGGEIGTSDIMYFSGGDGGKKPYSYCDFRQLPTFGIYSRVAPHHPYHPEFAPVLNFHVLGINDETFNLQGFGFRADKIEICTIERTSTFFIYLRDNDDKLKFEIEVTPFGSNSDEVKYSNSLVPFLPLEQRDAKYWTKVAEMFGLVLGETKINAERDNLTSYEVLTENPNLKSLRFYSWPAFEPSSLFIEAEFNNEVSAERFREFYKVWRGKTDMVLTNKTGELSIMDESDIRMSCGDFKFKGRRFLAEMPRGRNYLTTGLIGRLLEI